MTKKKQMAIRMQSKAERLLKGYTTHQGLLGQIMGGPFNSMAWLERKDMIKRRIAKATNRIRVRKAERLQALKEGKQVVYSIK